MARRKPAAKPAPTPYSALPPRAFWRSGVAEPGLWGMKDLWASKWVLPADARFATFGSCFAQHISRALVSRRMNWVNAEPAPNRAPKALVEAMNYGVFSARTGNIYTAAQLLAHVRMAAGLDDPAAVEIWPQADRVIDSLRPAIEPDGFADAQDLQLSRASMVRAFRRAITGAEVFVFTLGLTEGWENAQTGQVYPLCPGTAGGVFDADRHRFVNYTYPQIYAALDQALGLMWQMNAGLRVLLTVSPVPLTATASGDHVLSATTYSKSVLRAVAGDLARFYPYVDYFPSYEVIAGAPARSGFYEPNLRSVAKAGVDVVMGHFFAGLNVSDPPLRADSDDLACRQAGMQAQMEAEELVCEEKMLERFNAA